MTNYFKAFDFTELLSNDSKVRKSAQQRSRVAMQHPLEYYDFLTREISTTSDEHRALVALLALKMLITEVKFSTEVLLQMLEYYSNLFIISKKETFIETFKLLLQTLLVQIDSSSEEQHNSSENQDKILPSSQCYIKKEGLLLQGALNGLNFKFLLVFLSIYLDHLTKKNINLLKIRQKRFKDIYERVNSIKFGEGQQQIKESKKIKGQFFVLLLLNTRKICFNVFFEYFTIIPKQMCDYGIEMMEEKLICADKMNFMLTFFFQYIINIMTTEGIIFLKEQIETHLSFSKLLGLLISQIDKLRYPIQEKISSQPSFNGSSESQEDFGILSGAMAEEFLSQNIIIEDHKQQLYLWIFKVLLIHNSTEQVFIFELVDPLESIIHNFPFEDTEANDFVKWMVGRLSEGQKGDEAFEDYCYYFYYLQGHFYKDNNENDIKLKVGQMALEDLKTRRFAKNKDMCSVLFYLKMFIGTMLAPINFHSSAISTIMSQFRQYNCSEFSQAILTCFTRDIKKFDSSMCEEVTNSIWPLISNANPQMKEHILRNLRQRLEQEEEIDTLFLGDLLNMINEGQDIFEIYYLKEAVFVKVEYLRLISLSIVRLADIKYNIREIVDFLTTLIGYGSKDILQIQEMLEIFAVIFRKQSKKNKITSIIPNLQIVNLLVNNFCVLRNYIKQYQPLLIQIASLPFSRIKLEETIAVNNLQALTMEYLLSFELDDRLCDVLEVFFTLNQSAISEAVTACILAKPIHTPNYYRMVYLLSPRPYPVAIYPHLRLNAIKHYKWAALYIIGKYEPPNFKAISRSPRDQTAELVQQFGKLGNQASSEQLNSLMMFRDNLEYFSKDDENIWLSGIEASSVSNIFSQLYQERYQRNQILQAIKKLLLKLGAQLI